MFFFSYTDIKYTDIRSIIFLYEICDIIFIISHDFEWNAITLQNYHVTPDRTISLSFASKTLKNWSHFSDIIEKSITRVGQEFLFRCLFTIILINTILWNIESKPCLVILVNLFKRKNENLIRRGRRRRPSGSHEKFLLHEYIRNSLQRIKSLKLVAETLDKTNFLIFMSWIQF